MGYSLFSIGQTGVRGVIRHIFSNNLGIVFGGVVQAYGTYPAVPNERGDDVRPYVAEQLRSGEFQFNGPTNLSAGSAVTFDIAQGTYAPYATNLAAA
jgi:hypothetical protein